MRRSADENPMVRGRFFTNVIGAALLFVVGCTEPGSDAAPVDVVVGETEGCASPDLLCVGLVLAPGDPADSPGVDGVQAAVAENDGHSEIIRTDDFVEYREGLESLSNQGFDLIFARPGPDLGSAERAVLGVANGSDAHFVYIGRLNTPAPNVAALVFDEREAAFLAGAMAGLLSESGVVAAVFATNLDPATVRYKEGWEAGARFTNPEVELLTSYHPGALDISFDDPLWSADAARKAVEAGADVVFGAGGVTGKAALVEVARGDGLVRCIGAESDNWNSVVEARSCLATSAVLMVDGGIADIVKAHLAGEAPSGNIDGDVGLVPFHDAEMASDLEPALAEISAGLEDGSIRIP